ICGVWKNLAKPLLRQLQNEQMRVTMVTSETFSSILTSAEQHQAMGGIAMLTLSDTENNLHFILILQGLLKHIHTGKRCYHPCRGFGGLDPDFAEVLMDLNSRELFWLSRGQLEMNNNVKHIPGNLSVTASGP
ncbi:hypothetical protein CRUP_006761, partial [Coryphaenoides rupestris]